MESAILGQPDVRGGAIGAQVREALAWKDADRAWFAVAWAKRSGLRLVEPSLRSFARRRGTRLEALIGLDQHGATIEGLALAMRLFTEVRVYHDASVSPPRTFHPKVYVVQAPDRARVIIGSGNMTAGGLYANYEVATQLHLDLGRAADRDVLASLRRWFEARWTERAATIRLSKQSLDRLIADPDVIVVPERFGPPTRSRGTAATRRSKPLFGVVKGLARPPVPPRVDRVDRADSLVEAAENLTPPSGDASRVLAARLPKDRWGQAGFNRRITEDFFGVRRNGEILTAQAVERNGSTHPPEMRRLIFPSGSNKNHRIELPEPEGRPRPGRGVPVVLVHELGRGTFRYLYVLPEDRGYRAVEREIDRRPTVGICRKRETRRVYLSLGDLRRRWPTCPLATLSDSL